MEILKWNMKYQETPKLYWKIAKKIEKISHLMVKNWIFNFFFNSLQFSMVQGSLNPNITFLSEKLWPVAWNKKLLVLYKEKNTKKTIKSVKMKILKNKNMRFFLMSQVSLNPKIRFLCQKCAL